MDHGGTLVIERGASELAPGDAYDVPGDVMQFTWAAQVWQHIDVIGDLHIDEYEGELVPVDKLHFVIDGIRAFIREVLAGGVAVELGRTARTTNPPSVDRVVRVLSEVSDFLERAHAGAQDVWFSF